MIFSIWGGGKSLTNNAKYYDDYESLYVDWYKNYGQYDCPDEMNIFWKHMFENYFPFYENRPFINYTRAFYETPYTEINLDLTTDTYYYKNISELIYNHINTNLKTINIDIINPYTENNNSIDINDDECTIDNINIRMTCDDMNTSMDCKKIMCNINALIKNFSIINYISIALSNNDNYIYIPNCINTTINNVIIPITDNNISEIIVPVIGGPYSKSINNDRIITLTYDIFGVGKFQYGMLFRELEYDDNKISYQYSHSGALVGVIKYDANNDDINHLTLNINNLNITVDGYEDDYRFDMSKCLYPSIHNIDVYIDGSTEFYKNIPEAFFPYNVNSKTIHLKNVPSNYASRFTDPMFDIVNTVN